MVERKDPVVHASNGSMVRGPLGEKALGRYRRDGFLWFEDLFSDSPLMTELLEDLRALERDTESLRNENFVTDRHSGALRSVFGIHEISERFDRLTRDPLVLGMVRQLLGGDVYIHQSRINDKAGFSGGGFNWHSDFETWHSEDGMPRMRAVSASLMLTDNNEFNGPLMLIPGSHRHFVPCQGATPTNNWKESLKDQRIGVPDEQALEALTQRRGIRAPKGGAGSLLLFECNTLHASPQNLSPWPRANAFFVYNSVENGMQQPYGGTAPRPEFLATRERIRELDMLNEGGTVAMR
ncbi:MAG: ectoine hydroxylase [Ectothiorhodospiraceae bacterium]|nr:ectoine hydroxylase [Ectothiorhodospiraceae bacterium]